MRFLADENFPAEAVAKLVAAGHDVASIRISAPGAADAEIVAWAVREDRIVLTFHKDFGELAWWTGLPPACGIVLFRVPVPPDGGAALVKRITDRDDWAGHFAVVEPGRVRLRPRK
jgi:predicted nuclease of predicted toxin-antitoxin system